MTIADERRAVRITHARTFFEQIEASAFARFTETIPSQRLVVITSSSGTEWLGGVLSRHTITSTGVRGIQNTTKHNQVVYTKGALGVLHEAVSRIAIALADVVNLLNPHVLIFGGALFCSAPELFLEPLKRTIKQRALEKSANEVQLTISTLGSEAGALGSGRLISEIVVEQLYQDSEN